MNQISLSLAGSGTEGRRAPPQVQLVLGLEQLYNPVMENTECFELHESTGSQHLGLEYRGLTAQQLSNTVGVIDTDHGHLSS